MYYALSVRIFASLMILYLYVGYEYYGGGGRRPQPGQPGRMRVHVCYLLTTVAMLVAAVLLGSH